MKKVLGLVIAVLATVGAMAQSDWCGTDHLTQQLFDADPQAKIEYDEYHSQVVQLANSGTRATDKIIIPTVVHVLWNTCENDISKAQILDGLRVLNEDMARVNPDTNLTRDIFKPYADGAEIEFRLAQIDPSGNPTDGINRIQTSAAVAAGNNIKSMTNWPPNEYFNIWVVETIANFTGGGGIILGYAQFPGWGSWSTYGIVMRNDVFGTIGTSGADGRTLTHEVGHCLDLYHTFQSGCGGSCSSTGDGLCDTPPSAYSTQNCDFSIDLCSNDGGGDSPYPPGTPDQIENYMSYNDCQNMFTIGQIDRSLAALSVHSTLTQLTSQDNLEDKGVVGMIAADFDLNMPIVCEGVPTRFYNSSKYDAESLSWDFGANAQPQVTSAKNPLVTFSDTGLQTISLNASAGSDTVDLMKDVVVVSQVGRYLPFSENFEGINALPDENWVSYDWDDDGRVWEITDEVSYSGDQCLKMNNYGGCGLTIDQLYTHSFDFSPYSSIQVNFKGAYVRRQNNNGDFLRMYVSNDRGETWNLRWVRTAAQLESAGQSNSNWAPTDTSEWKTHTINLGAQQFMTEGLLMRFEFGGRGGNNFYMDEFEITGVFSGDLLLQSPSNGEQLVPIDVKLDWKSVGGVEGYEYQFDTDTSFSSPNLIAGTTTYIDETPNNQDTEFELTGLDYETTYFWRARYDTNGVASAWTDTWSFTTQGDPAGVEESFADQINVYPNPAADNVIVESTVIITDLRVMDIMGRVILDKNGLSALRHELSIGGLSSGLYLIEVGSIQGNKSITPLQVQ